jgi:hypothetical protein
MGHTSAPGPKGTVMLARVDVRGGVAWNVDTGIDRFTSRQILPGASAGRAPATCSRPSHRRGLQWPDPGLAVSAAFHASGR